MEEPEVGGDELEFKFELEWIESLLLVAIDAPEGEDRLGDDDEDGAFCCCCCCRSCCSAGTSASSAERSGTDGGFDLF